MVGSNSCHQGWKQMPHASPPKIYPPGPEPPSLWDPQSAPDLVGQTRMAGSVWTLLTQRLSSVFLGLQLWREGLLQPCHCSVLPHIVGTGEAVHSWGWGAGHWHVCTFDLLLGGNSLHGALELEVAQLLIYEVGNRSPQGHFKTSDLTDICTSVFTAGFFTIAIKWKQFNCLAADPWINKIEYMHTMQQYRS